MTALHGQRLRTDCADDIAARQSKAEGGRSGRMKTSDAKTNQDRALASIRVGHHRAGEIERSSGLTMRETDRALQGLRKAKVIRFTKTGWRLVEAKAGKDGGR